jgi:DNA-directed RNA polymerase specialized sigma24 family protein
MKLVKSYTDDELVAALATRLPGQELISATRFLFRQYFEPLRTYVTQHQGTQQDAEAIFQEVVVTFIELVRLNKFHGQWPVETLLPALNRALWQQELKKWGREIIPRKNDGEGKEEDAPDVSHLVAGRESRQQALNMVERLDDSSKKILLAFYYENAPMKQILRLTGYNNEQAACLKKDKALKQLEQMLTANPGMAKKIKSALHYER